MMIREWWIEYDLEGTGCYLVEVLSRYFRGGLRKNTKILSQLIGGPCKIPGEHLPNASSESYLKTRVFGAKRVFQGGTLIYSHDCCLIDYILPLGHVSLFLILWWIMSNATHKVVLNYVYTQPHFTGWEQIFVHLCYAGSNRLKCMSVWLLSRSVVTWLPTFTSSTDSYLLGVTEDYSSD